MSFATYAQIRDKVLADLDLEDEVFITSSELLGYANEAIQEAESVIHSLCEDYFLTYAYLPLVNGQSDYDLPTGIFADKIRQILYASGTDIYPITRLRLSTQFEDLEHINLNGTSGHYRYLLTNALTAGRKIVLYPASREDSATNVKIWHIRNARQITLETDVVDINEFRTFIEQHMKVSCLRKEGHPGLPLAVQVLDRERQRMVNSLTNRVPDNDDTLEQDVSFYQEHS